MVKKYQNLFPTDITQAAKVVYETEFIQPVLLKLQKAYPADADLYQSGRPSTEFLNPDEFANLERYKLPKRKSEYLTGRICAKIATHNYLNNTKIYTPPVAMANLEIYAAKDGRPIVRVHQPGLRPVMDISITHSGDYGAALATGLICGIDLQQQAEALLKVKDRYCTKLEERLLEDILPGEKSLTRLSLLWAAKEAAKKALSYWWMPGFLDLQATALENKFTNCIGLSLDVKGPCPHQVPKEVTVITGKFRDYGLAICLINKDSNSA